MEEGKCKGRPSAAPLSRHLPRFPAPQHVPPHSLEPTGGPGSPFLPGRPGPSPASDRSRLSLQGQRAAGRVLAAGASRREKPRQASQLLLTMPQALRGLACGAPAAPLPLPPTGSPFGP